MSDAGSGENLFALGVTMDTAPDDSEGTGKQVRPNPLVTPAEEQRKPGPVRTTARITIHTRQGHLLFMGRHAQDIKGKRVPMLTGIKMFITNVNRAYDAVALMDDPYADFALLEIEERLRSAVNAIKDTQGLLDDMLNSSGMEVHVDGSVRPATFEINTRTPYGYRAADLLVSYDKVVLTSLSARATGLLLSSDWSKLGYSVGHAVRSMFERAGRYKTSGASRADFASANARAAAAVQKFGELPQDVLSGERRGEWAPFIRATQRSDD